MTAQGAAFRFRRRMAGVAYFAVIIAFLASQVAIYQKAFTPAVHVLLRTDHIGNQLQPPSDVKVRGVIVGEVRQVRSAGGGAELDLALQPDEVRMIPRDVSARLLPKTLFGERYVSLVPPARPEGPRLSEGAVISQDRSSTSIEIERVLGSLMPLLQAVRPDQLATTLNTVSRALDGRGDKLGDTLVELNQYLKRSNPSLPDLTHDLRAVGDVSGTYSQVAPELLRALGDLTTTTRTVVEQRQNLDHLYSTLTTASTDADAFLRANKENLIDVSSSGRPALELLAKYAPEYPCLFGGLSDLVPRVDRALGKGTDVPGVARLTVEVVNSPGKYVPGKDSPRYEDTRGPRCYPAAPGNFQPPPGGMLRDGTSRSGGGGGSSAMKGQSAPSLSTAVPAPTTPAAAGGFPAVPLANSPAERQLLAALLAPSMNLPPAEVPQWSSLLVGPMFRGAEVTVQ